jgi:hypothetical protein
MAKNLTPAVAYTTPLTVPENADPGDAAVVEEAFQVLANRIAYLKNGAERVRNVATVAALRALTGMAHNDVAIVSPAPSLFVTPAPSYWVFRDETAVSTDTDFIQGADDGSGNWHNVLRRHVVQTGETLPDTGSPATEDKWAIAVPNRLYKIVRYKGGGGSPVTVLSSSTPGTLVGSLSLGALAVGDIVALQTSLYTTFDRGSVPAASAAQIKLYLYDGSTETNLSIGVYVPPVADGLTHWIANPSGSHFVSSAATYTLRVYGQYIGAPGIDETFNVDWQNAFSNVVATIYRP